MAKNTIIRLSDDLDGSEGVEELTFALRGVEYEIDLGPKNVAALEKALDKYMTAGRRVVHHRAKSSGTTRRSPSATTAHTDVPSIRAWAAENGYEVSTRGRIPADIKDAYGAAHG